MKKIILVLSVTLLYSCQQKSENGKKIAKVGGTVITSDYLEEKISELGPEASQYLASTPGKKQFLDMLINEKLVKMASESSSVRNSKEYKEKVDEMRKETEKRVKEYREYLLTRMFLEDLRKNELNINQEEIKKYVEKYPKMVVLEHIIAADYNTADEILKRMKSGTSLSKLVEDKKYEGKITGGKLPPIMPGEFLPELEDMIAKMKTSEIQGVVNSRLGFHIIKKTGEIALDSNKLETIERARKVLEKKKFEDYVAGLQKKYKVEVLDESYK